MALWRIWLRLAYCQERYNTAFLVLLPVISWGVSGLYQGEWGASGGVYEHYTVSWHQG